MRYQPSTICLDCEGEAIKKRRFCGTCLNKRAKVNREKRNAEVKTMLKNRHIMISGRVINKFYKDNYDPNNIITREVLTPSYVRK